MLGDYDGTLSLPAWTRQPSDLGDRSVRRAHERQVQAHQAFEFTLGTNRPALERQAWFMRVDEQLRALGETLDDLRDTDTRRLAGALSALAWRGSGRAGPGAVPRIPGMLGHLASAVWTAEWARLGVTQDDVRVQAALLSRVLFGVDAVPRLRDRGDAAAAALVGSVQRAHARSGYRGDGPGAARALAPLALTGAAVQQLTGRPPAAEHAGGAPGLLLPLEPWRATGGAETRWRARRRWSCLQPWRRSRAGHAVPAHADPAGCTVAVWRALCPDLWSRRTWCML